MYKYLFFLLSILSYSCSKAQSYFGVREKKIEQNIYYKLTLIKKDLQEDELAYPIFWVNSIHFPNIDTIKVIEELLSYEGDERLCSVPITCYSEIGRCSPNIYWGEEKRYSLQTEALFIINQIIFENPCLFNYMSNPVLQDLNSKKFESIKGDILVKAYQSYKNWLSRAKKEGISNMLRKHIYPLDNSGITWY